MKEQAKAAPARPGIEGVRNIVAIASGKGGVGKSTVAVNLAYALKYMGATVGLMDADIYGPSQPGMLGSTAKPVIGDNFLEPVVQHGIKFVSMGQLVPNDGPVVWRAPMATKMIQQFIGGVMWGELDYLLIDLPPGTGDVQLTLAQQASLSGAVIVTTPQDVALGVARKGVRMFNQVNVPIIGVIENMSGFVCKHCGEMTPVFKQGGGKKMAQEFDVPFLGALPLDPDIMRSGEEGKPVVFADSGSPSARAILSVAAEVRRNLNEIAGQMAPDQPQKIEFTEDGRLKILWGDDHTSMHTPYHLRVNCGCAQCVDEDSGVRTLDKNRVPLDISIKDVHPVGRYGLSIQFSDGHGTGIYTYGRLLALDEAGSQAQSFDV